MKMKKGGEKEGKEKSSSVIAMQDGGTMKNGKVDNVKRPDLPPAPLYAGDGGTTPGKRKAEDLASSGNSGHLKNVEDYNLDILRRAVEFKNRTGLVPKSRSSVALFCKEVKDSLAGRISANRLHRKLRYLREKMMKESPGNGGVVYELSNELWGRESENVDLEKTAGEEMSGFMIEMQDGGEGGDEKVDSGKADTEEKEGEGNNEEISSKKMHKKKKEGGGKSSYVIVAKDSGKGKNGKANNKIIYEKKKERKEKSSSMIAMQDSGKVKNGKVDNINRHDSPSATPYTGDGSTTAVKRKAGDLSGSGNSGHLRTVEDDNLDILRRAVEFKNRTGLVPKSPSSVALFYKEVKNLLGGRFLESQVYRKLRHLRDKMTKSSGNGGVAYELSCELWGQKSDNVDLEKNEGGEKSGFLIEMQDGLEGLNGKIDSGNADMERTEGEENDGEICTEIVHKKKKEGEGKSSNLIAMKCSGKGKNGKVDSRNARKKKKKGKEKSSSVIAMQDNGEGKNGKIDSGECMKEVEEEEEEMVVERMKKAAKVGDVVEEKMREVKNAKEQRVGIESFPYVKHALDGYLKDNGVPGVLLEEGLKFVDQAKVNVLEEKLRRHAKDEMKLMINRLTMIRELFAMLAE